MNKVIKFTVVIAMKNAESTILHTLKSLHNQTIQPEEIIIIDNVSTDSSIAVVERYMKQTKQSIQLIKRGKNYGVGASFNKGVNLARTPYVILSHSDSALPTKYEIEKLIQPIVENNSVAGTFSTILTPRYVWNKFNFWQKLLFARVVDVNCPGFNGKFDCINKKIFQQIGGYDDTNYGDDIGIGGEDGDLAIRLFKIGNIILSKAEVIHLHYLNDNYKFGDFLRNRKLLACSYGRLLRVQKSNVGIKGLLFFVKPLLCMLPLVPGLTGYSTTLLLSYGILYSKSMFLSKESFFNVRIILVPFINIFLLYYETYWVIYSLFFYKK